MNALEQIRFETLYIRHLRALKLQGISDKTIDSYARVFRPRKIQGIYSDLFEVGQQ